MKKLRYLCFMFFLAIIICIGSTPGKFGVMSVEAAVKQPEKVKLLKVVVTDNKNVRVTWKKATNTTEYRIYYKQSSKKAWEKLASVEGSKKSYVHKASRKHPLIVGRKYVYTVKAYNKNKVGEYDKKGLAVKIPKPIVTKEAAAYAKKVVELTNKERQKRGLKPLKRNAKLSEAAMIRAEEASRVYEHIRPDGREWWTVTRDVGLPKTYGYGENLVKGLRTPKEVVKCWMNSLEHRANIMKKAYSHVEVGVYKDVKGVYSWCQEFMEN